MEGLHSVTFRLFLRTSLINSILKIENMKVSVDSLAMRSVPHAHLRVTTLDIDNQRGSNGIMQSLFFPVNVTVFWITYF